MSNIKDKNNAFSDHLNWYVSTNKKRWNSVILIK